MYEVHKAKNILNFKELDMRQREYYEFIRSYTGIFHVEDFGSNLVELNNSELQDQFPGSEEFIKKVLCHCQHKSHYYIKRQKKFEIRAIENFFEEMCGKFCSLIPARNFLDLPELVFDPYDFRLNTDNLKYHIKIPHLENYHREFNEELQKEVNGPKKLKEFHNLNLRRQT